MDHSARGFPINRLVAEVKFRFSSRMIRVVEPASKLFASTTRPAKRYALRRSVFAQLGKGQAPLHPLSGAARQAETVAVSAPSAVRL